MDSLNANTKRKVAFYSRVSTEEQASKEISSLDSQEDLLHRYIEQRKKNGYELIAIYREEGISGTSIRNRLQLQQLLLDARKGKFDLVLVTDLDRIGRNLRDFLNMWEIFKENNVKFIAINQNIDTSTITGEALIQQLMVFAELESKMNRQRAVQKREYEITKKGKWYGGTNPLGYEYNKKIKRLIPNKEETELVNLIFDLYLEEGKLGAVATRLNTSGYQTRKGNLFSKEAVRTILRNPTYLGLVHCNGNPFEGEHEAIIDREKWERVQELLDVNRKIRKSAIRKKYQFLLRGLVRCGDCGFIMTPKPAKSGRYLYYSCTQANRFGHSTCEIKEVSASDLDGAVVYGLKQVSMKDDFIEKMVNKANQVSKGEIIPLQEKKGKMEQELQEVSGKIKTFIEALKDGKKTLGAVEDEMEVLENRKDELAKEISLLGIKIDEKKRYIIDGDILKKHLTEFREVFDGLKPDEKERLVRLLVREVAYNDEKIKISLWDLPQTDLSLEAVVSKWQFAERQVVLPLLDQFRTYCYTHKIENIPSFLVA
jgi:site-specific DNA recombinase